MKSINRHLLLIGILCLAACNNAETKTTKEERKVPVEVIQVHRQPREEMLNFLGTVEPNREMKVSFKIGGKIKSLAIEEGHLVKAGTLLAQLDLTELMAKKEKALENKNKAKRDMDRMEKLFKKNIVPESSFQDSRSLFISASAELKIVEDNIKNSTIRAPFTGRITKKLSEVGEIISPAMPVAILTEMEPILVKASVPDNFIQKIRTGKTVHVLVDSHPQEKFKGVINRIETTVDPLSRTFRVEIRLANPGEKLRPGLIAHVEIIHREKGLGIFIPLDSIIGFGSNPTIFLIKNLMAKKRMIKTGKIMGDQVEVLEGLVEGEILVVSGQEYLKDQQLVLIDRKVSENI